LTLVSQWLGSEKLSRQGQRHAELCDLRTDLACKFLLSHQSFNEWYYKPICSQLVIFGDMGCGKSVASAFLVDKIIQKSKHQLPQAKVCYHYCQDDESGQAIHIFSVLILELLNQFVGLRKTFYDWYKGQQASGHLEPAVDIRMLDTFLQQTLRSLDRPLFIIIDGLDECDRNSREHLLNLLTTVSKGNPRVKSILVSRPNEEIFTQLGQAARIDILSDANRDAIIAGHTVQNRLSHLSNDAKVLITEIVSRRAQGSAIWTRMMVEPILIRKHQALGPLQDLLDDASAPKALFELYDTLLLRCSSNDSENYEIASTALRLLAVTRRPLSIIELSWAVALAMAPREVTTVPALARLVDHHRILGFVHPFINRIDLLDLQKRQIRLAHQSVRDFVRIRHASPNHGCQSSPGVGTSNAPKDHCIKNLEASMLDVCMRYLSLDEIGHNEIFSAHQREIDELPLETDLFEESTNPVEYDPCCSWEEWEKNMICYDPAESGFGEFFVYSSCHWLEHFGTIDTEPFANLASIEFICEAGSTRLHNWIEQNRRPGCAIKPRFPFESSLYDPLSITALYGSENMLLHMLQKADFDHGRYSAEPAAAATVT
jgi:hypothetical protein